MALLLLASCVLSLKRLNVPDLKVFEVPMDGNCLFSAVALSAALADNMPAQTRARAVRTAAARLRASAMDVLCPDGQPDDGLEVGGIPAPLLIEPLVGETSAAYCSRLRNDGEWGSTAEVLALTRVLRRAIHVHTDFGVERYDVDDVSLAPISIHFDTAASHYRAALASEDGSTAGLPEGDGDPLGKSTAKDEL